MTRRNTVYIRILLIIVAVVAFLAFSNRSPQHAVHNSWLPSSFNPAPDGTMALYQTLQELNWPVERWREPLSRLPAETGNVMLITRSNIGWRVGFTDEEAALLDAWVQKGNTLLLFGALDQWDDTQLLLRTWGFSIPEKTGPASLNDLLAPFKNKPGEHLELSPSRPGAGTLIFPQAAPLPIAFPEHAKVLWQNGGQPYVIEVPRGAGRVVCAASAQWIGNGFLDHGDNLRALLGLLAPMGQVPHRLIFEESHHGYSEIFAIARLLDHPGIRVGGMLALLGLIAFLGSSLVRFGPVMPIKRDSGRSTLEFVASIADLYQRANLRNELIAYLFTETHQRVIQQLHLPATASHDVIAARLKQAFPHLPPWKKLARRFDSRDHEPGTYVSGLPPSGWLRVARELIEIKSAMA